MDYRERWLTNTGLSPRMRDFTFDSFPHQADSTFRAVREFVTGWRWDRGLLLSGGFGIGKTGLIAAALNLLVDWSAAWLETDDGPRSEPRLVCRHTARLYAVPDLFDRLRAGYDDGSFTATMRDCQECDLLILDDLGTEKPTDWVRERLFAIVNHRYEHEKPIWVTTNLGLDALERAAGERVVWRLLEAGDVIVANGANLRERVR